MSPPEKLNGMAIADTSIRQPVFITMIMLLVVVIGALAYSSLPVNLLPDIDIPTVAVIMTYPGAGAESMADQVAKPLEDQLQTLNGLDHITSVNREGVTQLIIAFKSNISVDRGLQDVRDKVNAVIPACHAMCAIRCSSSSTPTSRQLSPWRFQVNQGARHLSCAP